MKPFRFNLQALLTLRQRQEHLALEQYAQTLLHQQQARNHLAAVERELVGAWTALGSHLAQGCRVATARHSRDYCTALELRRHQAENALAHTTLQVQRALETTHDARRQREVVDKLRERQLRAHSREAAMAEHKLLDEMAGRRPHATLASSALS